MAFDADWSLIERVVVVRGALHGCLYSTVVVYQTHDRDGGKD
jgi:hypothetical protein